MKKSYPLFKQAISSLNSYERNIFNLYFMKNKKQNVEYVGKKVGISKQRVSFILSSCIDKIKNYNSETSDYFDSIFKSDKYIYFDSSIFWKYSLLIGKISVKFYGFSYVGKGLYTTDPHFKHHTKKRHLSNIIKKEGLPLSIKHLPNKPLSKNRFAYLLEENKSEWLIHDDIIYGNENFTFCTNCCKYQIKKPVSMWEIYEKYHDFFPYYIEESGLSSPLDLCVFIQRRISNIKNMDKRCSMHLVSSSKENEYNIPIYEMESIAFDKNRVYFLLDKLIK